MTGWRKVCDVEQGGGPFRPGKLKGRSGVGVVVISSQQGFLVEERKKSATDPRLPHSAKQHYVCTGFKTALISALVSPRLLCSRALLPRVM